jgi:hypothetical protein
MDRSPLLGRVADGSPLPEDTAEAGLLSGWVVLRLVFAGFLLVGAPLVWAGSYGSPAALLALFYGGIVSIVVGFVLAFILGVFVLSSLMLTGIVWIVLERFALSVHAPFALAAVALVVIGVLLFGFAYRPVQAARADRKRWESLTGGSVAPASPPPPDRRG